MNSAHHPLWTSNLQPLLPVHCQKTRWKIDNLSVSHANTLTPRLKSLFVIQYLSYIMKFYSFLLMYKTKNIILLSLVRLTVVPHHLLIVLSPFNLLIVVSLGTRLPFLILVLGIIASFNWRDNYLDLMLNLIRIILWVHNLFLVLLLLLLLLLVHFSLQIQLLFVFLRILSTDLWFRGIQKGILILFLRLHLSIFILLLYLLEFIPFLIIRKFLWVLFKAHILVFFLNLRYCLLWVMILINTRDLLVEQKLLNLIDILF